VELIVQAEAHDVVGEMGVRGGGPLNRRYIKYIKCDRLRWRKRIRRVLSGNVRFVPKADIAHRKATGDCAAHGSADEHDLAGRSGLKNLSVRASCFGEWQYFANNGAQSAVFETCKEPGMDLRLFGRCNGPQRERAN
jgi:hypothetical protein